MKPLTQAKATRGRRTGLYLCATACALALGVVACTPYNENVHRAVEASQNGGAGLVSIANRFAAQGNHSAAIPLYREAVRQSGGNDTARLGLGRSLAATGQYAEAVAVLSFARKLDGGDPLRGEALAALGAAEVGLGNVPAATESYRQAAAAAPDLPEAASGLAVAEDMNGNHEAAVAAYDRGLEQNQGDLQLRGNKGLSLALAGETVQGIALLEDVVRDPKATVQQRQNLALAYVMAGDEERGRQMASIDLARDEVSETIGFFTSLRGMPKKERMVALMAGARAPETTIRLPANRVVDQGDGGAKAMASSRVVGKLVNKYGDEVDESGLPPKMDATGWAVQVAAYRTPQELIPGWHIIKEKFKDIIGHLQPRRSEIDFGDRVQAPRGKFYRLNAGPLRSKAEADAICKKMKASIHECWVRPPEPAEGKLPKGGR